ncbi:1,4-dihydroxy-2-naphthoate octaprenyltransferase [Bacillus sp. JUb91]|nr:1,4-dihydroxy-2-naphthoate octaprenyltransferase [Bacillus sp. JUb91]
MNNYTAMLLMNLGVLSLTGYIFTLTNSWWSLVILICLFKTSKEEKNTDK